jgi:hypothetical protein
MRIPIRRAACSTCARDEDREAFALERAVPGAARSGEAGAFPARLLLPVLEQPADVGAGDLAVADRGEPSAAAAASERRHEREEDERQRVTRRHGRCLDADRGL